MLIKMLLPLAVSAFALISCGGDDAKKEDDAGSQYVVMPFVLGDTAKIDGASATTFSITKSDGAAASGAGYLATGKEGFDALYMTELEVEHGKRTLLNRFDSKLGMNQGADFWQTAKRLDAYQQLHSGKTSAHFFAADGVGPTEAAYRASALGLAPKKDSQSFAMTATKACPAAGDEFEVPSAEGKFGDGETRGVEIPAGGVDDTPDFCLIYFDEPTTAGTRASVKATVTTVLQRFKTVIYKDTMPDIGDYSFKPIVVVIDFANAAKWPQLEPFQIAGAYVKDIGNNEYKRPVLFMASKDKSADTATATKVWHGTVAHEMQHAVMDYYKGHKAGLVGGELTAIDEGLAHNIEDLFGYGQENFGGFAKSFLSVWANKDAGGFPILTTGEVNATARGAAQTFWYYMISQKGGINFSEGVPASGGGLDFIATSVKSDKRGVANLAASYGGIWTDVLSGFYGALVLDGTKVAEGITVEDKYEVQDVQTISDLNGNTDKKYGMRFNGYEGVPDTRTYELTTDSTPKLEDVSFYQTIPLLYTGTGVDALKYTSDAADATNQGVAKIKIK